MAEIVTFAPLTSIQNDNTAVATINANFQITANALADCLSLLGTQPNAMKSNLDMNSFSIINLAPPATVDSPVRLSDIMNSIGIPANTYGLLNGSNIWTNTNTFTSHVIMGASVSAPSLQLNVIGGINTDSIYLVNGAFQLVGSSTGYTTFATTNSTASNFTITIPSATDTMVLLAATQTLTNKTLTSPAITGGSIQNTPIGSVTPSIGAFTTLSASSTVSGTGFSTYLASPPAIGTTAPAAGKFTTIQATSTGTVGTVTAAANTALTVQGSGATNATNSFIAQNSSGVPILTASDNTAVLSPGFFVTSDLGGIVSSVGLSNVTSGVSTGTGTIKMNSGNAANSAGWIKIYAGTTAFWVPIFTTNAP